MKVGDIVSLSQEPKVFAVIESIYDDIDCGVLLDRTLAGFRSWNIRSLNVYGNINKIKED